MKVFDAAQTDLYNYGATGLEIGYELTAVPIPSLPERKDLLGHMINSSVATNEAAEIAAAIEGAAGPGTATRSPGRWGRARSTSLLPHRRCESERRYG